MTDKHVPSDLEIEFRRYFPDAEIVDLGDLTVWFRLPNVQTEYAIAWSRVSPLDIRINPVDMRTLDAAGVLWTSRWPNG